MDHMITYMAFVTLCASLAYYTGCNIANLIITRNRVS